MAQPLLLRAPLGERSSDVASLAILASLSVLPVGVPTEKAVSKEKC